MSDVVAPEARLSVSGSAHRGSVAPVRAAVGLAVETAVFLLALLARLHGIAAKPYWMDEVTTLLRSAKPLTRLVADSLRHHHLPSYFILTSWLAPFGTGEEVMRLPSAVFGAMACAVLCGAGRAVGGVGAGLLAGLLLALSPMQVQYGQEARSYALLTCMVAIALRGLLDLALDPPRAALPLRAPGANRFGWAAYIGGTVAALNVLSVALFWVAAATLAALFIATQAGGAWRGLARNWLVAHAIIAALSLPWFVAMYWFVDGHIANGLDWVPPLTLGRAWSTISSVFLFRISSLISFRLFPESLPGFGALVVAAAALGGWTLWQRRRGVLAVLLLGCALLPASLAAISMVRPIWMPRYVLLSGVPFCLLAGLGVARLPERTRIAAAVVLAGLAAWNLGPYYKDETKPRWDLAAADLNAAMRQGDFVLVDDPQAVKMMNLYLARIGLPLSRSQWTTDVEVAAAALANDARVWAVQGTIGQADERNFDMFLARITGLGSPALQVPEGLDIQLLRFDGAPRS